MSHIKRETYLRAGKINQELSMLFSEMRVYPHKAAAIAAQIKSASDFAAAEATRLAGVTEPSEVNPA